MKMNLSQNMFTFLYSNTFSFLWGSSSFVKVGLPQLHSVPIIILDFEIVKVFSFQLQLAMVSFSIKVFIFYKNHLQSQLLQLCHPFHLFEKMQLLFQVNVFSIAKKSSSPPLVPNQEILLQWLVLLQYFCTFRLSYNWISQNETLRKRFTSRNRVDISSSSRRP